MSLGMSELGREGGVHHTIDEFKAASAGADLCPVRFPLDHIQCGFVELQHGGRGLLGCDHRRERECDQEKQNRRTST